MRKVLSVLAVGATAVAVGCASLGRQAFREPVVNLRDVTVSGLGLQGGSLDVSLSVYNPNGFRLDATRMTYRVLIDSVPLANGLVEQRLSVQERDSTVVRVPVNFTYSGLGQAGRSILNRGGVSYTVTGDVTVGTPLGNFTVPYSTRGTYSTVAGSRR